jgi:hypothetical protein
VQAVSASAESGNGARRDASRTARQPRRPPRRVAGDAAAPWREPRGTRYGGRRRRPHGRHSLEQGLVVAGRAREGHA